MHATPTLDQLALRTSDEVFHACEWGLVWGSEVIEELKAVASTNPRNRARLCLHPLPSDPHQEMLIVLGQEAVERAQRRTIGFDTKIALEGSATLRYFTDAGALTRSVALGATRSRYVHTTGTEFHSLKVESEWFVFLEVLTGPFDSTTTEFAPWS